jgi:hypothetical protein
MEVNMDRSKAKVLLDAVTGREVLLNSGAFSKIQYNGLRKQLTVVFRGDKRKFRYDDIPLSVYEEMITSDSVGSYYNKHVRGKKDGVELPPEREKTERVDFLEF